MFVFYNFQSTCFSLRVFKTYVDLRSHLIRASNLESFDVFDIVVLTIESVDEILIKLN